MQDGLKSKGYYAEQMTPQFVEYVVKSAPLHDTGKIKISDTILNKPGRFTPEEYEIMKKHAVYGKEIIDKAISTVDSFGPYNGRCGCVRRTGIKARI